jgi:hypothetical protein
MKPPLKTGFPQSLSHLASGLDLQPNASAVWGLSKIGVEVSVAFLISKRP